MVIVGTGTFNPTTTLSTITFDFYDWADQPTTLNHDFNATGTMYKVIIGDGITALSTMPN